MAKKYDLQRMRRKAGFTSAKAFAEHIGMSVNTYTAYEQGRHELSLVQAWEFADILDCTLDELAGRHVPDRPQIDVREQRILDVYRASDERGRDNIESAIDREARYMDESAFKEKKDA